MGAQLGTRSNYSGFGSDSVGKQAGFGSDSYRRQSGFGSDSLRPSGGFSDQPTVDSYKSLETPGLVD